MMLSKKLCVYDKLVAKVNNTDTSGLLLKTKYETGEAKLEKKTHDVTDLVKKAKLTELENKIPDISGLVTKSALTAVENKMPDVSSLVKKVKYDTKTSELEKKLTDHNHDQYVTTPEFNTLAATVFNARQILMLNCQALIEKLLQIKQKFYLLKMGLKN